MDTNNKNLKKLILKTWKDLRIYYDKNKAIEILEQSFMTGKLEYAADNNAMIYSIKWGTDLNFLNSEEGRIFIKQIYELNLRLTLVNFKKEVKRVYSILKENYNIETVCEMIAESIITGKLEYNLDNMNGKGYVCWRDNDISCFNSEEGKEFLREEIYQTLYRKDKKFLETFS